MIENIQSKWKTMFLWFFEFPYYRFLFIKKPLVQYQGMIFNYCLTLNNVIIYRVQWVLYNWIYIFFIKFSYNMFEIMYVYIKNIFFGRAPYIWLRNPPLSLWNNLIRDCSGKNIDVCKCAYVLCRIWISCKSIKR